MTTSEHSQAPLFEDGPSERWRPSAYATPQYHDQHPGEAKRVRRFGTKHGGRNLNDEIAAGVEPLTSSLAVTPASHSHSPGGDWARRMTVISGRRCAASLTSADRVSSWLRTLLGTSTWASTWCYLTWKRTATTAGRSLFRLVPSTPSTGATGFGSWPTPKAGHEYRQHTAGAAEKEGRHGWKLPGAVADSMSETPTKQWGTPTSRDWKDGSNVSMVPENGLLGRQVVNDAKVTGKLHGRWTLALMGYPPTWCDLDGQTEAGSTDFPAS